MCQVILILGRQLRSKRQRRLSQVMDEFSITHQEEIQEQQDNNNQQVAQAPAVLHPNNNPNEDPNDNNRAPAVEADPPPPSCSKSLWKLMKIPVALLGSLFGLGEHYMSDYFDSMGTGDALRDARLRVWLRQDPSLADRHYMMVQSGMRYSFFLY